MPEPPENNPPWAGLPENLQNLASVRWDSYLHAAREHNARAPADAAFCAIQCRLFAISEFISGNCIRYPGLLEELLDSGDLLADSFSGVLAQRVGSKLAACKDEVELSSQLRQIRRREMLRIAWRDLAGWAPLEETLTDLSDLADACIQGGLERLSLWQSADTPQPKTTHGKPASLIVLAMGKLGAHELNFSSDIDLIFAYPDALPGRKRNALGPEEYFTRLGQSLIQVLSDVTHDGFVFRVDMRLRPYGSAGALVCSFEALEEYYQFQGREWERYAMIKARPVTGEAQDVEALMQLLRPFVYRRYLDFEAFNALRDLKQQIQREVERKGQQDNIKLGPGGIREIEFIAQAFQLVRGGREQSLRKRGVIEVLNTLASLQLISQRACDELVEAYMFLRRAENRLQEMQDRQAHHLPDADPDQSQLALAMGYPGWKKFGLALYKYRNCVERHFHQVFALPQSEVPASSSSLQEVWLQEDEGGQAVKMLAEAGYADADEALRWLRQLRTGTAPRYLGTQGRERFDALVPMVIAAVAGQNNAAEVLGRLVHILEQVAGRTTYLALLQENPMALTQLVKLCAASPWIAQQIARFPLLLDELLDPRTLYSRLDQELLQEELAQRLEGIPQADLEQRMDRLRQFRHGMVLRIAAADIAGAIPVAVVSDELTAIAQVILGEVLKQSWMDMLARHGKPLCKVRGKQREVAFIIIAYGKMGGIELGYGSDLDLVFLHDSDGKAQKTDGKKPVDNAVFFARLGQRIIHALETYTGAGVLYEVDMRLRPSGNSGLLVSSIDAFADYQKNEAWTWEHQALIRARKVAGDDRLAKKFEKVRLKVLSMPRDAKKLRDDVVEMREKMRSELGSRGRGGFHFKQDRGGIVDIEFMVQYLVLGGANSHPELLRTTDTTRLLKALAKAGLLEAALAESLVEIYQLYRSASHSLTLGEQGILLDDGAFRSEREQVKRAWKKFL